MAGQKTSWFLNILYIGGTVIIFFVLIISVTYLSNSSKWIYSLVCAVCCFITAFLSFTFLKDRRSSTDQTRRFIFIGIASLLLAARFVWIDKHNAQIPYWMDIFLYFSVAIYYVIYRIIFVIVFPTAEINNKVVPEEQSEGFLKDLPEGLREIVADGIKTVNVATIYSATVFAVLVLITTFFLGGISSPLAYIITEIFAAIIFTLIIRYVVTYLWQKRVMQSGIAENEIKPVARLVGLPWLLRKNHGETKE